MTSTRLLIHRCCAYCDRQLMSTSIQRTKDLAECMLARCGAVSVANFLLINYRGFACFHEFPSDCCLSSKFVGEYNSEKQAPIQSPRGLTYAADPASLECAEIARTYTPQIFTVFLAAPKIWGVKSSKFLGVKISGNCANFRLRSRIPSARWKSMRFPAHFSNEEALQFQGEFPSPAFAIFIQRFHSQNRAHSAGLPCDFTLSLRLQFAIFLGAPSCGLPVAKSAYEKRI